MFSMWFPTIFISGELQLIDGPAARGRQMVKRRRAVPTEFRVIQGRHAALDLRSTRK